MEAARGLDVEGSEGHASRYEKSWKRAASQRHVLTATEAQTLGLPSGRGQNVPQSYSFAPGRTAGLTCHTQCHQMNVVFLSVKFTYNENFKTDVKKFP